MWLMIGSFGIFLNIAMCLDVPLMFFDYLKFLLSDIYDLFKDTVSS
jgi:hypothetical protein